MFGDWIYFPENIIKRKFAVNIEDIYIPRNNPTYPPMLPIKACISTSFD